MADGRLAPQAIAVVGLAGRFPGARGLDEFWLNVRNGVETLEDFDAAELDAAGIPAALRAHESFVAKGTDLQDAECFDAGFFGFSPREAQLLDPQQRVFLECAWEALEHAGYAGGDGKAVGVYAGASMNTYLFSRILKDSALLESAGGYQLMLGNDKDFLCTRVSYKLDLRGPSMTIQTACSTSLVAVAVACRALQHGECNLALAGGVSISFPQRAGYVYQEGMIFSPDGHCRPFDAQARGTRAGAGAGVVVLKRLADALADGDTVHAVIRGAAINNDGAGKAGYTAPSIDGQAEVIAKAQAMAGIEPRSISYMEAHGTGTPLGDPIEIAALTQVFRSSTPDVGFCRLGSLKANLGHLDAAAGVAGLIKTVLALQHRELPPLVNFNAPNPQLDLDRSPFCASASCDPWTVNPGTRRRAGVSAFGIGGTNAHVVLEEAPDLEKSEASHATHLLIVSAKTAEALEQASGNLADHLERHAGLSLADVAWTLQAGRKHFSERRVLVARDHVEAVKAFRQPGRAPVLTSSHAGGVRPVAFMFSGQGSQHAGMGQDLYRHEAVYRIAVDRCAELLTPHLGLDIREVLSLAEGDPAVQETRLAQPLLFVTEYALASLWMAWGVIPRAMIGHSIGEYVAAHLAGVMSLPDVLRVVAARGRLMQALPAGRMAAVHLDASDLARWLGPEVELAAVNAPGLCTVSGSPPAVEQLLARLQASGVQASALHTSHAFHSAMMEPALAPFRAAFADVVLSSPRIPYVSNLTGTWITDGQATEPDYYLAHLRQAVKFEHGVRTLSADSALCFLEIGPGNVLTTLARISLGKDGADRAIQSLAHPRERRSDREAVLEAAGRLWLAGVPLDWKELHAGAGARRVPLPTYPFERKQPGVAPRSADPHRRDNEAHAALDRPGLEGPDGWFFAPAWTRDDSLGQREVRVQGLWLVLGQDDETTRNLTAGLKAAGAAAILVEQGGEFQRLGPSRFQVRPHREEDYSALFDQLEQAPAQGLERIRLSGVMHLWRLASESIAIDGESPDYRALLAVACGAATSLRGRRLQVLHLTMGSQSVLAEPVFDHGAALFLGAVLVLPTEIPGLVMRTIDFELHDGKLDLGEVVATLLQEASSADGETVVARRAGRRWVRRFERQRLPPVQSGSVPVKERGIYLISGGLGGIGLALARWLAGSVRARLVLTSRRLLPPRVQWDDWLQQHLPSDRTAIILTAIRDIESAGGEVMVCTADAADETGMREAVAAARARWGGAIDGVVHAAGTAGTGQIALRQSIDEARAVFAPKIAGMEVLVRVLGKCPLDFVVFMSSINALIGSQGACDYSSANAVLDAFVESDKVPDSWRHVAAINWAAWRDVGMAANLTVPQARQSQWQVQLRQGIPTESGVQAFARVLQSGRRRMVVSPYDLTAIDEQMRARLRQAGAAAEQSVAAQIQSEAPAGSVASAAGGPLSQAGNDQDSPQTPVQRRVAAIWSELLGVDNVGLSQDFFQLGGHSLLATRVLARVDEAFGVRLALRDIFDAPTVGLLTERITALVPPELPAVRMMDEDREEIEF